MRSLFVVAVTAAVAVARPGAPVAPESIGPGRPPGLGQEDAEYLDALLCDFLFDPKGASRIRVTIPTLDPPDPDRPAPTEERGGWLVRANPSRIYFADGSSIPAAAAVRVQPVPFLATCQWRYAHGPARPDSDHQPWPRTRNPEDSDLALAAWLHRLGQDELAARALAAARGADANGDPREELRKDLARRASEELLDAFCRRADAEALAHGERLFCLYPDLVGRNRQATRILADLARRQRDGTFGRTPSAGFPPWFALWGPQQKLKYLIASLDQIDAEPRWRYSPLETDDRRYVTLVGLGELAIPALLDVIETDRRLTRLPERYRGERTGRVISVRERAEAAVRDILGVREFNPTGVRAGRNPGARVAQMRQWWETYGRLPPAERMMKILTDPRSTRDACLEAAGNLARPAARPERWDRQADQPAVWPNPAAARFERPTVAEAILAALDRGRPAPGESDRDSWERAEYHFLNSLVELGDRRVAAELSRRAGEMDAADRRRLYARAAHRLGASGAWTALARDFERGTLALARGPDGTAPHYARAELALYLDDFDNHPLPDTARALYDLADPTHPCHRLFVEAMLDNGPNSHLYGPWHRHPACLAALRTALDDITPTGRDFYLRGDEIEESGGRRPTRSALPGDRPDPAGWAEHAEERVCDVAAVRVTELVVGVPPYHPLQQDAEPSLAAMKAFLDRHGRRFRRLRDAEARRFDFRGGDPAYAPDIRPLGRPAIAADVSAGRAVFHLAGTGKEIADPPAAVVLTPAPPRFGVPADGPVWLGLARWLAAWGRPEVGLVIQAEVGADGKVVYGVIFRHAIRVVRADEVEPIELR